MRHCAGGSRCMVAMADCGDGGGGGGKREESID